VSALLDSIYAKCEDFGECRLWTGRSVAGSPKVWVPGGYRPGRRIVYEESRGRPIQNGLYPVMRCRNAMCLHEDHIAVLSKSAILKLAGSEGRFSSRHSAAVTAGRRKAGTAKLDMNKAREVRASEEPVTVLAERFNVDRSMIYLIKQGKAWREVTQGASIFNL
jgi:hypothetical protein